MGKKSFLALLLSALLMLSPAMQLFSVAAVSDGAADISTISGGDQGNTKQLSAPVGLQWVADEWSIKWDKSNEAGIRGYSYELYKDGKLFDLSTSSFAQDDDQNYVSLFQGTSINESGSYTFRVKWLARLPWDDSEETSSYIDSEWSEFSQPRVYTRPEKALGAVPVYWGEEQGKRFLYFKELEDVGVDISYTLVCYYYSPGSDMTNWSTYRSTAYSSTFSAIDSPYSDFKTYNKNGIKYIRYDIDNWIQSTGAGKYRAQIQALSFDIDKVAHGPLGEFSEVYDTTKTAEEVSDLISEALANSGESFERALETIKENIDIYSLRTAMQTDSGVLNQMKELESGYVAEQNITVNTPKVSEEAAAYVKASDISVIGAGLNAEANSSVTLEIGMSKEEINIPSQQYRNSVQLDISLKRDGESVHELDIPITITMPVPTGIDLSRLVILHYYEDGTFETVNPKNNGDGTITFTIDRFSTFVFIETGEGGENPPTDDNTNKDSGSTQQNNDASTPMQSPKTGEGMDALQILAYAIIVLAAGIGTFRVWKKKENEETAK